MSTTNEFPTNPPPGALVELDSGVIYKWDEQNSAWRIVGKSGETLSYITTSDVNTTTEAPITPAGWTGLDVQEDLAYLTDQKLVNWFLSDAIINNKEELGHILWIGENQPGEDDGDYIFWWHSLDLELLTQHNGQWFPVSIPPAQAETLRQEIDAIYETLGNTRRDIVYNKSDIDGLRQDITDGEYTPDLQQVLTKGNAALVGAQFGGKVIVEPGEEGNEVVTYNQLMDLEEEIESISPSLERGEWKYINDYHLDRIQSGQYFSGIVQTEEARSAENQKLVEAYGECAGEAGNDPTALAECNRIYSEGIDALVPVGEIKPSSDFSEITHLIFHKTDVNNSTHSFATVEVGNQISILDEADDDYLVGIVDSIDNSNDNYVVFEITVQQSRGEANPQLNVKVRFFSVPGDVDTTDFATKSYVDSTVSQSSPIGTIVFWGGLKSKIPSGWAECRGQHAPANVQTLTGLSIIPDLQNWMPAGMGGIFGTQEGQRITSKIQKHHHTVTRLEPGSTQGNPDGAKDSSSSRYRYWRGNTSENGSAGSSVPKVTSDTGSDFTAPPVWIGVYIMRIS